MKSTSQTYTDERRYESYPKRPDDPSLPPEMELVRTDEGGLEYRFRDTGLRLEIDGETYVPEAIAPTDGYVTLVRDSPKDGMVRAGGLDVKLHVDMSADIKATGGEYDE